MKNIFSKSTITSLVIVGLSLMPALRVSATSLSATTQTQQPISTMAQSTDLKVAFRDDPFSLDWLCKTPEGRRHPWSEHAICPN
ncbi:hypothetical protein [Pseudanabaena mucicola]|uniref:Uncharacterized protein n=1 Tax=Pseudanabaena mucicola FACHB-723 TaxID=2692860 RepID=A0ABR8A1Z0_9CYAN|nr:hypothetical protein [Pseudanabaena mucicola]MBD2189750.1 hypothetical protein [Pseudanabaena mucicola FACHB-723]